MIKIRVTGLKEALRQIDNSMSYLNRKVPFILQESGNKMVVQARSDHRFNTKSGQLERAITADVNPVGWELMFYIDPDRVTNKGYNYGWVQHDGSGTGYKKSYMSRKIKPKLKSGGIEADHFMVRAFESEIKNLERDITNVLKGVFR